jgi:hypothetical protein
MAYSKFSLKAVKEQLGITVIENTQLFKSDLTPKVAISEYLQMTLAEFAPLALSINTEKSRSEWIIAPVLAEVRKHYENRVSLFSGTTFNVDEARGLEGQCDYILSLNPEQLYIAAPIMAIVEAKKEDIVGGVGQCISTMYAAHLFNEREHLSLPWIYGAITTGTTWKFLKLNDRTAYLDRDEYYLKEIETLMGIFCTIVLSEEQPSSVNEQ